ncbi:MAG: serine hydrolase [Acidobacteria bacterium]|nr:serine hydrolase [Acidobacteriota bacterium]
MRLVIFFFCTVCFLTSVSFGQIAPLIEDDGVTGELHRANVGRVTFMAKPVPPEDYRETDFLTSFELRPDADLNIRVFMRRSLTNYLHGLAPEMSAAELVARGNYRFSFFVDDRPVYTENLNAGAGALENKNRRTVFRVPLLSPTNEDSWGRFLWNRFMMNGGEDALTPGAHRLKIEIRPYLQTETVKIGELIAEGALTVVVKAPEIDERRIAVQKIAPGSGWPLSNDGFDREKLRALNRRIAENYFKEIDALVVVKNGRLLIEEYFNGAGRATLHDTHSVGKTFASALAGLALRDGYLKSVDQRLGEFYDLRKYDNYDPRKENVTLRSLLTMSSGFDGFDFDEKSPGNEENMYPQPDWVKWTLDLPMSKNEPGARWAYFTAGVVVLGDILDRRVPGGLEKYAARRLFGPLGIDKYEWQYTPQKVVNTAGGLRMPALSLARFGQLYKNGGRWGNRRILPAKWVADSLQSYFRVPGDETGYGFLWWSKTYRVGGRGYEVFYCSGNGGSKIVVFKDLPFVVVIAASAYNRPYMHAQIDKMMTGYLIPMLAGGGR